MGGIFDGNIVNDPSVSNALGKSNQEKFPYEFGFDELFEYLDRPDQFSAGEVLNNPPSAGIRFRPGKVKQLSTGDIFLLVVKSEDFWVFVLLGKEQKLDVPEQPNTLNGTTVTLNSKELLLHLKGLLFLCERARQYVALGARVHKEAVQDAVDIVQSKRLDFKEAKDKQVDVTGVLISVVIIVFFEAGIAATVASIAFKALKANPILKKLVDFPAFLIGKISMKDEKNILKVAREEQKILESFLETNNVTRTELLIRRGFLANQKNLIESAPLPPNNLVLLSRNEIVTFEAEIAKNQQNIKAISSKNYIIEKGKDILGQDKKLELVEQFLNKSSKGIVKDSANTINNKIKGKSIDPSISNVLPIEVYLKTYFQDMFEPEVIILERYIDSIKSLIFYIEMTESIPDNFAEMYKFLPSFELLQKQIDDLSKQFDADFNFTSTKEDLTKEYEFFIWSMYFVNDIEFTSPDLIKTLLLTSPIPQGREDMDDDDEETFEEKLANDESTVNFSGMADFTKEYLTQRFSMDIKQMAINMVKWQTLLTKTEEEVNEILKNDSGFFQASHETRIKPTASTVSDPSTD